MSEINKESVAFSDPDSTFDNYRPFSPAALGALIFAILCAVIAMATTWLVAIPGVLVGLWCLIALHLKKEKVLGYTLALLAVAVCVFAIAANIYYHNSRMAYLATTAEAHAHTWLKLSQQGKYHEAYQLTLTYAKRQKPGTQLPKIYGDEKNPLDDFKTYLNVEPERVIRLDGEKGKFSTLRIDHKPSGVDREQFILMIKFEPNNSDLGDRIFEIYMERKKHLPQFGPIQWFVFGVENIEPRIPRNLTKEQE